MKSRIEKLIKTALAKDITAEVSVPSHASFGHYSTNVAMRLAREEGRSPLEAAKDLAEKISAEAPSGMFSKVEVAPPGFINFWLSNETLQKEVASIYKNKKDYGQSRAGKGKKVIVEYSSPNIAKPMHVGHLRNIILGDSLANVFEALGYKIIRWNYIGDWGTQFGKLIAAYKWWGDKKAVEKDPIGEMVRLYVRFHKEAKERPELESEGREEFKKLEAGDSENRKLWIWFKKESLREFEKMYKQLGVKFDVEAGESFFEKDMEPLIKELLDSGVARISEGAAVIPLDQFGLLPGLIRKSDGASLYLTRDIANLRYRIKKYKPAKILYVIGNEQSFQFEQLFAVADVLGLKKDVDLVHVKYGLVLAESGKKFSTREGVIIPAEEIIQKATELAAGVVEGKRADISKKEKEKISGAVGVGALKYFNLKEYRTTDVVFDWEKMLSISGESGPYLQYTYARFSKILKKAGRIGKYDLKYLSAEEDLSLAKKLLDLPSEIEKSAAQYATNNIALYLYEVANLANRFYEGAPILKDEESLRRNAKLVLIGATLAVLKNGLKLLGISTPEEI